MRAIAAAIILLLVICAVAVPGLAEAPRNFPQEHRLYAPCPWAPWAMPKRQGIHQV